MPFGLELVQYRDAGMHTYTYFWVDERKRVVSPYFNSDKEAYKWFDDMVSRKGDE